LRWSTLTFRIVLIYCIYSCANSTTLNKLKIMQKKAIRIVCNANYRDHTGPLFKQQKILTLDELIKLSVLKFMHKYTHGKLPLTFNEMWITNRNRNPNIELRNSDNYYVPAHYFATTKRFPFYTFPRIWNEADLIKKTIPPLMYF
jgi:hypothetical protein